MEKTIFILREAAWTYCDEPWLAYKGVNKIYRKFATYGEALAEKNRLELDIVRNHRVDSLFRCNANFGNIDYYRLMLEKGCSEYLKEHFGIDWKGIEESDFIDKSKVNSYEFRNLINSFILEKSLRDDRHILYLLQLGNLNFYEISEVKETDSLYRVFVNEDFKDFPVFGNVTENGEKEMVNDEDAQIISFYYGSWEQAQEELNYRFYFSLQYCGIKGSYTDLSEAPDMLKNYIETYKQHFIYDVEKALLNTKYFYDTHVMRGFVALLRSEKIPFIIKAYPISGIPEKYLEEEEQKIEKERQERLAKEVSARDDLPF